MGKWDDMVEAILQLRKLRAELQRIYREHNFSGNHNIRKARMYQAGRVYEKIKQWEEVLASTYN